MQDQIQSICLLVNALFLSNKQAIVPLRCDSWVTPTKKDKSKPNAKFFQKLQVQFLTLFFVGVVFIFILFYPVPEKSVCYKCACLK